VAEEGEAVIRVCSFTKEEGGACGGLGASEMLVVDGAVNLRRWVMTRGAGQGRRGGRRTLPSLLSCSMRRATVARGIWQLDAMSAIDMPVEGSPRSLTI
jgi:hypothetical protein